MSKNKYPFVFFFRDGIYVTLAVLQLSTVDQVGLKFRNLLVSDSGELGLKARALVLAGWLGREAKFVSQYLRSDSSRSSDIL